MNRKLAYISTFLTHPFLMPLLGVTILFTAVNWMGMFPSDARLIIFLTVLLTTFLLPLLAVLIMKSRGVISDYLMPTLVERKIPLLLTAFFYMLGAYTLQKISSPLIFPLFINAASVVALLCALVSWKWKISTHMAGIAGLIGLVLGISLKWMIDLRPVIILLVLLAGVAGWARLRNDEHSQSQVYAGFALGFTVVFLLIRFI